MKLTLAIWFAAAVALAAAGVLAHAPVPLPAIAILLSVAALLASTSVPALQQEVNRLGLRTLIGLHLIRVLAGAYFLILNGRGVLPAEFAIPAGWGDIVVGAAVIPVLALCVPITSTEQRNAVLAWNTIGLIDILFVLGNAMRTLLAGGDIAGPFSSLPLALLPTFVVPLIIASHLLVLARLRREPTHN